jgi:O-antigen/teichoic acid export membrane protein
MVSTMTGQVFAYLERFMIASILSVGFLTYYAAPFELISKVLIFPTSAAGALFPFASQHGRTQPVLIGDVSARMLKYLLLIMSPMLAIFAGFAGPILQFWLGPDFAAKSAAVLQVLAFAFFVNALAFIPFTSVQALGRPDLKAILDLLALPAFALYAWVLMRYLGIAGAAWAKLLCSAIDCGFLFIFAWKMGAFQLRTMISGPLFKSLVLSAALTASFCVAAALPVPLVWSAFVATVCLGLYALGFWMFAADADEKVAFRRIPTRLFGWKSLSASAD